MPRLLSRLTDREQQSRALVDALIESWVCWREACDDVRGAYEHWCRCTAGQRGLGFAHYRAALEREDQAALVYSNCADRVAG